MLDRARGPARQTHCNGAAACNTSLLQVTSRRMSHVAPYSEPLRELAAEAYEISGRLCGACGDLHALWPYIRLSRASTGVEAQESKLQAELRGCFARGLRDVLIAGSQDAGLLALVAHAKMRAGAEHPSGITVLDICETPLELCRRLAGRWSLPIETIREDLAELSTARRFDLVLVHGTLHFMAADRRLEALRGIASALRPGGRLVLLFNTSRTVTADSDQTAGAGYGGSVLAELARLGVPLPATEAVMRERLDLHQRVGGSCGKARSPSPARSRRCWMPRGLTSSLAP